MQSSAVRLYTLSLHDALPIWPHGQGSLTSMHHRSPRNDAASSAIGPRSTRPRTLRAASDQRDLEYCAGLQINAASRSEEHTSELQSLRHLVCRLLLEKTNRNR